MTRYGSRIVVDSGFEAVLGDTSRAIREEGLRTIARVDVRDQVWWDLGHNFGSYFLLTAWSPELAFAALRTDPDVGVFLPTTFAIYEVAERQTAIIVKEPLWPLISDADWRRAHPELAAIADRETERVARVRDRLECPLSRRASVEPAA